MVHNHSPHVVWLFLICLTSALLLMRLTGTLQVSDGSGPRISSAQAAVLPDPPAHPESDETLTVSPAQIQRWKDEAYRYYLSGHTEAAMPLYLLAASAGDISAMFNAAAIRLRDENHLITLAEALALLRDSASGGFAPAQFGYGVLFLDGTLIRGDAGAAMYWFERAAEQGHADAAEALASCYYHGHGGKVDYAQAARWYEVAARGGISSAQHVLAAMFEAGIGVAIDAELALQWYTAAALQGDFAALEKARALVSSVPRLRH